MPNLIPREEYFTAPSYLVDVVPKKRYIELKFGASGGSFSDFPVESSRYKGASRGML